MQTPPTPPSASEKQRGQLAEYDALITALRDARSKDTPLTGIFLKPPAHSLFSRAHDAALKMGDKARSDSPVGLVQILSFHGLQTKPSQDADALIPALEEMRASHLLGLENGMDIDELIRGRDHKPILDAVSLVLDDGETSVIESLGKEVLTNVTVDQLRANPAVYLERMLTGAKARALAQKLLKLLDWYGTRPDEVNDPYVEARLVAGAIRRWHSLTGDQPDDTVARFRLDQPSNWGKSYQTLRSDFESYLVDSGNANTTSEAILLSRLLQPRLPKEFRVRDIPGELPYRSSIVWVNFIHGVNLAHAVNPALLSRLTFQQLVEFPIKRAADAPLVYSDLITLTRIAPTHDWAMTNGIIGQAETRHTEQTILVASTELATQTQRLTDAINYLDAPQPERLNLARIKLKKIFGEEMFKDDGFKLVEEASQYTVNPIRHGGPVGRQTPETYSFVDVYASGKIYNGKKWFLTLRGEKLVSDRWIKLNADRMIESNFLPDTPVLPDVRPMFETAFKIHLDFQRSAYQKLIMFQLASLPWADRLALEYGAVRLLTLRKQSAVTEERETAATTLPLRARKGFVLEATHEGKKSYYELIPRAGIIRRRPDFDPSLIGGIRKEEYWGNVPVHYLVNRALPFDWEAHTGGGRPKDNATCKAIIDPLGERFAAPPLDKHFTSYPCTLKSKRINDITFFIVQNLFYVDEKLYRAAAYGETQFDKEQKIKDKTLEITKLIVPFWGSFEDLTSGDLVRIRDGFAGIFVDVATFVFPIGKFVSGSLRLATTSGRLSVRATLPSFATLTKKLLVSNLNNLNPIDGIPSLIGAVGAGVFRLGRFGFLKLKRLAGRTGEYNFVQGLPQASDPGRWKPLVADDQLGSVNGIEDIALRRAGPETSPHYYLIDPASSRPYGPKLSADAGEVSLGRSEFLPLGEAESSRVFDIPQNARLQQIPEVDGRTTLLIDNVPYRLDQGALRRVDVIDAGDTLNIRPCRVRRAPDEICLNSYVHRELAPTPELGSHDPAEDFCPWFGDRIYTPAPVTQKRTTPVLALDGQLYSGTDERLKLFTGKRPELGLPRKLVPKARVDATVDFRKGIYGRVRVKGIYEGLDDDMRQVSSLIIESKIDAKKEYIFTQLNATDYYFAEISKGQSLARSHRLQRIPNPQLDSDPLYKELFTVFTGSLHANNTAAIYGVDKVKQAIRTMDEIAVPLGGFPVPSETLSRIKVSTSPGEAILFDHRTRMIVSEFPASTKAWTRSKEAPEPLRKRTAEIFNVLFEKKVIKAEQESVLQISNTMRELQAIVRKEGKRMDRPRNIAYAEIKLPDGKAEVYVSVSGRGGDTGYLPLFEKHRTKEVKVGETTYINVDHHERFPATSLDATAEGQFYAIPPTIKDISTYTPELTRHPVSLDSESKLIRTIRARYPDDATRSPVTVATTMAPCESCSVLMQQFAHTGGKDALKVIWD
ncbi:hypothetical protein ACYZT9_08690 [Pseudomonas sp. ZT5P21]